MFKTIMILYFSGTGGTERVANTFEADLKKRNCIVSKANLDRSISNKNPYTPNLLTESDLVILIYPVYAVDAPPIIYDWINQTTVDGKKAVVISVSGGGEVWPNTGCRNNCNKALEQQGFEIVYEKMLIMPANCIIATNDNLSMLLINALPDKVAKVLDNLFEGKILRTNYRLGLINKYMSKNAKDGFKKFAKDLQITERCSGCRLCSIECPVCNIEMKNEKPSFGDHCIMCLRCIYNCPNKALKSNISIVFKAGYNLPALEKRMEGIELPPIEKCAKGILWKEVKKYLLNKESGHGDRSTVRKSVDTGTGLLS